MSNFAAFCKSVSSSTRATVWVSAIAYDESSTSRKFATAYKVSA